MDFKITTAALEGFRMIRREPKTVAGWALMNLVINTLLGVAMVLSGFGRIATSFKSEATVNPEVVGGFLIGELLMAASALLIAAVFGAAVYRAILRPEQPGFARVRIGADEGRLLGLSAVMVLVFIGIALATIIPIVLIPFILGMALGNELSGVAGVIVVGVYIVYLVVLTFFATRLSLAGAMTFSEERLQVFGSWGLTKGRFWKLLGVYALAGLTLVPFYLVLLAVYAGGTYVSSGSWANAFLLMSQPDFTSLAGYFKPIQIVYLVLSAILGGVVNAVMYAPAAVVYRALAGSGAESKAEVFS